MLVQGWEEGEGLGKEKQGIKGYVRVKNKQDTSGIGTEKPNAWAFDTSQFDNILKKLKVVNRAKSPEANYAVEVSEEEKLIEIHLPDMEDIVQDVPPEWWGHKFGFVTGGLLGAEARRKKALLSGIDQNPNGRTTFNEDDQENLYKLVQDKATSGKQGLGIKDRTKKVAGCYFQGKKTTFGDSDGEDSSDSRSSLKRKHEESSEMEKCGPKPKLKKLCKQLLQQVPGESLKLKQLKVLVDEQSPSTFSNFSSEEALTFLKNKV
ncbi:hypothetical protein DH2020_005579 [Rehmannia glutinosa]|uniref:G-patch domain-containing protein n=1 Tax=Rehmannia glutinosa TaxID=99300 RepID=A0ABR0XGD2_REHGL